MGQRDLLAIAIAIYQLFNSSVTLYSTSKNAMVTYGYAAYSLTVIPYAVMSLFNLIAQAVCPTYSELCLIRTEVMNEAESRGLRFGDVAGRVDVPQTEVASDDQTAMNSNVQVLTVSRKIDIGSTPVGAGDARISFTTEPSSSPVRV